jgi:hypothetical protein
LRRRPGFGRRGISLFEFAAASVVLAVAMTLGVGVLAGGANARQNARNRELVLLQVGNLAERVRAAGFGVTPEQTAAWISELKSAAPGIPEAELSATIAESPGPPAYKVAVIRGRWRDRRGVEQPAVQVAVVLHQAPR